MDKDAATLRLAVVLEELAASKESDSEASERGTVSWSTVAVCIVRVLYDSVTQNQYFRYTSRFC
jgi:hypothetical protein